MAKNVTIPYIDGNDYTLEFNREVVKQMESRGFRVQEFGDAPINNIETLFAGALRMHHPRLKSAFVDLLFESIEDKVGLMGKLIEMYSETYDSMLNDPEDETKKVKWVANF